MLTGRWPRRLGLLGATAALASLVLTAGAGPAAADSVRTAQGWVLSAVNAQAAWQVSHGQGVTVAVIDSGVSPAVSDLTGSVVAGPDYTGVRTPQSNPGWGVHGTWMASLIAGHGHDGGGSGIIGIAPKARVLSIRVITDSTDPNYASYEHEPQSQVQGELANAINYAVSHGAGVISMSLGYGTPSLPVRSALQNALSRGVVVVASSGNSGDTSASAGKGYAPYSFPADYPGVLGVAALSKNGAPAGFSSDNISVQVAAPGDHVPAQGRDGGYWLVSGTSPACALTAGVAALIKSADPSLPPDLVREAITATTTSRPEGGYDEQVGFGTVNAAAALAKAAQLAASRLAGPGAPAAGPLALSPGAGSSNGVAPDSATPGVPATSVTAPGSTPPDSVASRSVGTQPSASPSLPGISVASRFGGGPAAIPPAPVTPRSITGLALLCLLAFACMWVIVVSMRRLATVRPAVAGGSRPGRPATSARQ